MQRQIGLEGGGTLTVREDGARVHFSAVRTDDARGLYKVWLRGVNGRLLLGTLVPEGGELRLSRAMSRATLEREGCWPVAGGETVMAYPFGRGNTRGAGGWHWHEQPHKLLRDPPLVRAARGWGAMYHRADAQGFALAARYSPGHEFPMIPIFCFARVERVCGHLCAVWEFDENGMPRA